MSKPFSIFLLTLILASLACGSATSLPTPEPALVDQSSPVPDISPSIPTTTIQPTSPSVPTISVPGLTIAYIHEGNLWLWIEAEGSHQMTDSGGLSTIRFSPDGQILAFIRGTELWLSHADGSEARILPVPVKPDSRLWFAPTGSILAVASNTQIELVDLGTESVTSVLTYPAIADNYTPEVIWTPDAFGFKTVIPSPAENGQSELLFVFSDGTVANLAKFPMVSLVESRPLLSPDGGYVVYVSKLDDGKHALYLMDSSGATRPYSEGSASARALSWLPDAKRFVYALGEPARIYMGDVTAPPTEIALDAYESMHWINTEHFLAIQTGDLYLGDLIGGKVSIAAQVSDFDFKNE